MRQPSEYVDDRNRDLWNVYKNIIFTAKEINFNQVISQVATSPAQRFWISPERASKVINRMIAGDSLSYMKPHRRSMFYELYNRFLEYKKLPQYANLPTSHIMVYVVEEEAPSFYLTNGTIQKLLSSIKHDRNA